MLALCKRNHLELRGNCHEERPWDESSYKPAGEADETPQPGSCPCLTPQARPTTRQQGSQPSSEPLEREGRSPSPRSEVSARGLPKAPCKPPQMMSSAHPRRQEIWGHPSLPQAAPLASEGGWGSQAIMGAGLDCSEAESLALRGPRSRADQPPNLLPNVSPFWGKSQASGDLEPTSHKFLAPESPSGHSAQEGPMEGGHQCRESHKETTLAILQTGE